MFEKLKIKPPSESSLRRRVDINYEKFINHIKMMFENQLFNLIVDETQLSNRRFVNVLIRILGVSNEQFLINTVELFEPTNSKNIGIIVDDVIKNFGLNRDCFHLLISDAAAYMVLCAKNLKLFYSNMIHITCFAYAMHNCAFKIKKHYQNVDLLIGAVKGLVNKNFNRIQDFAHLEKIPQPIVTRWGSWLNAALYYCKNFDEVSVIVESLEADGILISNAKKAVRITSIKSDLIEIKEKYSNLAEYIEETISQSFDIKKAKVLLENISFPGDQLNLKQYLLTKIKKSDFYSCFENEDKSPYIIDCLKNSPATSIAVERSFSMLGKILLKERGFNSENIKKYAIFNYNQNYIAENFMNK